MQRPDLTPMQKAYYEAELNTIMALATPALQEKWKSNPQITWVGNMPLVQPGITTKLPRELADRYLTLENHRKSGTLKESE
jgi:hypothetical protein